VRELHPDCGQYWETYDKYGLCNDYKIAKGREFSYLEIQNMSQVCILGSDTAEYLFSFADPIDKIISVNGLPFRVIGVYQSKAAGLNLGNSEDSYWMSESIKRNDQLLLLPSSMTRYFNNNESITDYTVKVKDSDSITKVVTDLNGFLSNIVNTNYGGYYVDNPQQWQDSQNEAAALQQRFLGGIAAISLLVGGIGIMNIMLVTVTERTREIGIRRAIGAQRSSIVTQFLIEAAMLCGIGGVIGILLGTGGSLLAGKLLFQMTIYPAAWITLSAFSLSVALGVIFGIYPAAKAAKLQPVEALRAE
jgi:putative ABC transport system permease protein